MVRTIGDRGKELGSSAVASLLVAVVLCQGASASPARRPVRAEPAVPGPASTAAPRAPLAGAGSGTTPAAHAPSSGSTEPARTSGGGEPCTSSPQGALGPYVYSSIVNSNGYNTYVGNNMWGAVAGTVQTTCASNPGSWTVVADAGSVYTGVQTYPNVQQLFNDWTASGWAPDATGVAAVAAQAPTLGRGARSTSRAAAQEATQVTQVVATSLHGRGWNHGPPLTDTPLDVLDSLSSTYATSNPSVGDFEAAYDIWLGNTPATEVMIWVYNVNRGTGGATVLGHTTLSGVPVTVMRYGSGELILSLDNNQASGTIDILGALKYLQTTGLVSSSATLNQIDFGWEICNTAGQKLSFALSGYSLRGS